MVAHTHTNSRSANIDIPAVVALDFALKSAAWLAIAAWGFDKSFAQGFVMSVALGIVRMYAKEIIASTLMIRAAMRFPNIALCSCLMLVGFEMMMDTSMLLSSDPHSW